MKVLEAEDLPKFEPSHHALHTAQLELTRFKPQDGLAFALVNAVEEESLLPEPTHEFAGHTSCARGRRQQLSVLRQVTRWRQLLLLLLLLILISFVHGWNRSAKVKQVIYTYILGKRVLVDTATLTEKSLVTGPSR